jgi:hypothetical protein
VSECVVSLSPFIFLALCVALSLVSTFGYANRKSRSETLRRAVDVISRLIMAHLTQEEILKSGEVAPEYRKVTVLLSDSSF